MQAKFRSKVSQLPLIILFVASLLMLLFLCFIWFRLPSQGAAEIIVSAIALIFFILFLFIWTATFYEIQTKILLIRSGPFYWKIKISEIDFIRLNQKTYGGIRKAALSSDGIEIKYKKSQSIFISPVDQELFIKRLVSANPQITIKDR